MRTDLDELYQYIDWKATSDRPVNNKSRVTIKCTACGGRIKVSIRQLKLRVKKQLFLCKSCQVKKLMDTQWRNPEFRRKHAEGCVRSYLDSNRKIKLSENSKKLWKNPEYRRKQIETKRELWKDSEYRKKQEKFKTKEFRDDQSKKMKQVWQIPAYRNNASEKAKETWGNPQFRANQSEKQSAVWTRPGYREDQSERQKLAWQNPEYRRSYEEMWQDPEYRTKLSEIIKNKWQDPEFKEKASLASKRKWDNPNYRKRIIDSIKKRWEDPTYKKQQAERGKALWEDPAFLDKMGKARAAQAGRKSSIEAITEFVLSSLQIEYEFQSPVGPFVFDFFLPGYGVFIEVQGEYWHSLPKTRSKDAAKFTYLEKAYPEAQLLYLHEHEFMNPTLITTKISNFITGEEPNIKQHKFNLSTVKIDKIDAEAARQFLNSFHYGAFGRSSKVIYGAFLGNELIAVCKMSPTIRKEVATSIGRTHRETLELDRFCIHPAYQKKNFASWFLSRAAKFIFNKFDNVTCLVSFADLTYGHSGTIYKAANWQEIGRIRPDYYYVGADGFILHKKTLYNRARKMSMKEREYAEKYGYIKSFGKEKIKYILTR